MRCKKNKRKSESESNNEDEQIITAEFVEQKNQFSISSSKISNVSSYIIEPNIKFRFEHSPEKDKSMRKVIFWDTLKEKNNVIGTCHESCARTFQRKNPHIKVSYKYLQHS